MNVTLQRFGLTSLVFKTSEKNDFVNNAIANDSLSISIKK